MPQIVVRVRVRLEPDLEVIAGHLDPYRRRKLASRYFRWAKQLWASAGALERPQPAKRERRFVQQCE